MPLDLLLSGKTQSDFGGLEKLVSRRPHKPEFVGSSPTPSIQLPGEGVLVFGSEMDRAPFETVFIASLRFERAVQWLCLISKRVLYRSID